MRVCSKSGCLKDEVDASIERASQRRHDATLSSALFLLSRFSALNWNVSIARAQ